MFRTQKGEMSIRAHEITLLSKSLQREGIVEPAPDEKAALGVHIAAGKVLDLLTICKARLPQNNRPG